MVQYTWHKISQVSLILKKKEFKKNEKEKVGWAKNFSAPFIKMYISSQRYTLKEKEVHKGDHCRKWNR